MISAEQIVLRLLVAAVLGALVGLERERLEWAAGMRTHALVSLGSALFMVVSIFGFSDILNERHVILDPSRVAAQVASGIGFIGAGTIIFRREVVKGLTTAASIWAVAAVGLAVGGGMFLAAVCATLLALALLVLAKPLKARMFPNRKEARRVRLVLERGTPLAELREEIEASEVSLERIVVRPRASVIAIELPHGSHDARRNPMHPQPLQHRVPCPSLPPNLRGCAPRTSSATPLLWQRPPQWG